MLKEDEQEKLNDRKWFGAICKFQQNFHMDTERRGRDDDWIGSFHSHLLNSLWQVAQIKGPYGNPDVIEVGFIKAF